MARSDREVPDDEVDFASILAIDEMQLDKEWVGQAVLFMEWAEKLADKRAELEDLKDALTIVEAELSRSIRNDPTEYGVSKVTEAAVKAAIPECKDYRRAVRRINKAKHVVDVYQALVTAIDHRRRALENLVNLHGQKYFSAPRGGNEDTEQAEQTTRRPKKKRRPTE